MTHRLRRAISGPVLVTAVFAVFAAVFAMFAVFAAARPGLPEGALLAWLLLGLTAGYALSGSA